MSPLFTVISMAVLAAIAAEDARHRLISWYWLPVLLLIFVLEAFTQLKPDEAGMYFIINLSFLLVQLLLVTVYFSIRQKRPVNIINTWLGIGDILFFVVLCAAFSPLNYLLFYLLSLLFTIAGYIAYKIIKGRSSTIPLAGAVALLLFLCLLLRWFIPQVNFYDDTLITRQIF